MSVEACAAAVARGDPDRFLAAMAAPVAARAVLLPLHAFALEIARAPYLTAEPLIAEMRLQWWRDALDEIAEGRPVRRHEVATPLAAVLDGAGARLLDASVAARKWDIARDAWAGPAGLMAYVEATAATPAWVAARALGSGSEAAVRAVGRAGGLARYLAAVPALRAAGRDPLPPGTDPVALARDALAGLRAARPDRAARAACLAHWQAGAVLAQVIADPGRVERGGLGLSEFAKRMRLAAALVRGRV
ncbi:MAG: squalene/phytoene synthase family protein [Rhodobacteraceae bacterium]|jgi:phytoene/squalene synthetase|nr:squalene/phytoene synthase family protein [Paracoccaceae bacterium]